MANELFPTTPDIATAEGKALLTAREIDAQVVAAMLRIRNSLQNIRRANRFGLTVNQVLAAFQANTTLLVNGQPMTSAQLVQLLRVYKTLINLFGAGIVDAGLPDVGFTF